LSLIWLEAWVALGTSSYGIQGQKELTKEKFVHAFRQLYRVLASHTKECNNSFFTALLLEQDNFYGWHVFKCRIKD